MSDASSDPLTEYRKVNVEGTNEVVQRDQAALVTNSAQRQYSSFVEPIHQLLGWNPPLTVASALRKTAESFQGSLK
jgi:hypothetical protein